MTPAEIASYIELHNRLVHDIDAVQESRAQGRFEMAADDALTRLVVKGEGAITVTDLRTVVDRQRADGRWHFGLLYDFRNATAAVTPREMRELAAYIEALPASKRGPVAVVTAQPALFGMARMYSMLTEAAGLRFQVFRDRPSAEHWLDEQQFIHG